jgi:zinc protease
MTIGIVSTATFEAEVLQSSTPVFVDFYTDWCGPCKAMAPVIDVIAGELAGTVKVVKIDLGQSPELGERLSVRGVPTLMLFKDGEAVARHVGALTRKDILLTWIQDRLAADQLPPALPSVSSFSLANGMDVVVVTDKRAPIGTLDVLYRAGAADAPFGTSGLAHLVERLTYRSIQKSGIANSSKVRARSQLLDFPFGNHDATAFKNGFVKDGLKTAMELEVDRMTKFRIGDEEVAEEIAAITAQEALKEMIPDFYAETQVRCEVFASLFRRHPYGVPAEGFIQEREKLSREEAQRFHERYYAPNNAVLVVAGNVQPEEVHKLAEETLGRVSAKPDIVRERPLEPARSAAHRLVAQRDAIGARTFSRSYVLPGYLTAKAGELAALEVLQRVLGNRKSGRLQSKLATNGGGAAPRPEVHQGRGLDFSLLSLRVVTNNDDLAMIEASVGAVIEDLRDTGVTEVELDEAKKAIGTTANERNGDMEALARNYGQALAVGRSMAEADAFAAAIAKVTADDVKQLARAYLDANRSVTSWLVPKTEIVGRMPEIQTLEAI